MPQLKAQRREQRKDQPQALIWDVDGTLAETERDGHRVAFNLAFAAFDLPWRWDDAQYGNLLRITGGRERLRHDLQSRADAPVLPGGREALARAIHAKKNAIYADLVTSARLPLREGVRELIEECHAGGVRMGIATTTSRVNVAALMQVHFGARWSDWFAAIVCGEDVHRKKPDPEVYELILRALNIGPLDAVAIEDSPGGVAAARAADIPVIVTRSAYFATASIDGAIAIGLGLHDRHGWRPALRASTGANAGEAALVRLGDIEHWRALMDHVSEIY